jgi:hypothetical protein
MVSRLPVLAKGTGIRELNRFSLASKSSLGIGRRISLKSQAVTNAQEVKPAEFNVRM